MSKSARWRVAHLGSDDVQSYNNFVSAFQQAYQANNSPKRMAMFSHTDSLGKLMAVSITPEAIPFCPFSLDWDEPSNPPMDFGFVGWVAGDPALK